MREIATCDERVGDRSGPITATDGSRPKAAAEYLLTNDPLLICCGRPETTILLSTADALRRVVSALGDLEGSTQAHGNRPPENPRAVHHIWVTIFVANAVGALRIGAGRSPPLPTSAPVSQSDSDTRSNTDSILATLPTALAERLGSISDQRNRRLQRGE